MTVLVNGILQSFVGTDGWTNPVETWTFASATTINVPNGALYQKGDKLKFTQSGTVKYFCVLSVSANVLTLVSQDNNNTVTVANAAITNNYMSRQEAPLGFPLFTWAPAWTGFSAAPVTATATFQIIGATCRVRYALSALGTSNATSMTLTNLPVAPTVNADYTFQGGGTDNGATLTTMVRCVISGASKTMSFLSSPAGGAWTASSTKGVFYFDVAYPF